LGVKSVISVIYSYGSIDIFGYDLYFIVFLSLFSFLCGPCKVFL
jgi:hypothetical protein